MRSCLMNIKDRNRLEPGNQIDIKKQIIELAVRHTLLTRFTAFVVVDESEIVNPDGSRRKIVQPVEMPARWEMDMQTLGAQSAGMPLFATMAGAAPPPEPMERLQMTSMPKSVSASPPASSRSTGAFKAVAPESQPPAAPGQPSAQSKPLSRALGKM